MLVITGKGDGHGRGDAHDGLVYVSALFIVSGFSVQPVLQTLI